MKPEITLNLDGVAEMVAGVAAYELARRGAVAIELDRTGLAIERSAKLNASGRPGPNVVTGNLRSSIHVERPAPLTRDILTEVEYANDLEYGTDFMGPYPFMGPAWQTHRADHERRIRRVFA